MLNCWISTVLETLKYNQNAIHIKYQVGVLGYWCSLSVKTSHCLLPAKCSWRPAYSISAQTTKTGHAILPRNCDYNKLVTIQWTKLCETRGVETYHIAHLDKLSTYDAGTSTKWKLQEERKSLLFKA